ncbi:MAG: DinB family protein [Saprospiraceae bacterium]
MASRAFLLKHHVQNRKLLRKLLGQVDEVQANKIPQGFNNNIIWNCAHVISIQQSLVYQLCRKPIQITKEQLNTFTIGTKPQETYDQGFMEDIKLQLIETSEKMAIDLDNEVFEVVSPFMTAIKVELTNIDDTLAFVNYHEGLHLGVVTSLLKFV